MEKVPIEILDVETKKRFPMFDNYDQLQEESPEDAEAVFDIALYRKSQSAG